MAHDVFISYSSKDKPTADAACAKLEARGIRCWLAPRDIMPGADWSASIIDAINGARTMVLVFSAHANASQQIKREVERAVNKGIPIIPLRIENVAPEKSLEYFISTPHWLDAFTSPLDQHLSYLADVIRHILDGKAVPEKPAPPPPPWWRGRLGIAAGAGVAVVLAIAVWFGFLRPPPSFNGTWNATALDIRQFTTENSMLSALVPSQLLAPTVQNPAAKGVLTIDPSGSFTLSVNGVDHGKVSAAPAAMTSSTGNTLTFVSDTTHQSVSFNIILFALNSDNSGGAFDPQTDPVPNGQTAYSIDFMPAGQDTGASSGVLSGKPDYQGTPDASGNMRTLDLIAGTWLPGQMYTAPNTNWGEGDNAVAAALTITADGHYTLTYTLKEKSLWHAANGNWSRTIPAVNGSPINSTDGGTYVFGGRNQVSLLDQFGTSTWQRGP
jgi:hypothetical protein